MNDEDGRQERSPRLPSSPEVLLVDDDDLHRMMCRTLLEAQGFVVRELSDADGLMEHLEEEGPPDVVLLDVMMPGRTGWVALADMRKDPRFAKVPVLFVTARDDEDFRAAALSRGAQGYLVKPLGRNELVDQIREALRSPPDQWG